MKITEKKQQTSHVRHKDIYVRTNVVYKSDITNK